MKKEELKVSQKGLYKAKTLQGEWVEGYYRFMTHHFTEYHIIDSGSNSVEIDPKTRCEQVRGTEFFEWDRFTDGVEWFQLEYDYEYHQWWLYSEERAGCGLPFAEHVDKGIKPTEHNIKD